VHPEDEPPHAPAAAPSALREPGDVAPLSPPPPPPERPPEAAPTPGPKRGFFARVGGVIYDYFVGEDLNFGVAVVPLCFLAMVLFTRHPTKTNFIFDEQEALLANPYVRSVAEPNLHMGWLDAFRRDFWGLPADRSIGSYRPIPDLVWRALWAIGARAQTPFLHHWVNVLVHGVNGALLALIVQRITRDRATAWLAGTIFVGCAVLTEAVSGVVGIADVFGGTGALLALMTLALSPEWMMPALFLATLFGLFSKESALCIVPLVPFAAFVVSPSIHPVNPRPVSRAILATVATVSAFVLYVELRRRLFPAPIAHEYSDEVIATKHGLARVYTRLLHWYAQPALPRDPLNNPLVDAPMPLRIAGALRVYARGLGQVLLPLRLSGDYSAPQEPIPDRVVFPESVIGGLAFVLPLVVAAWLVVASAMRRREEAAETWTSDRTVAGLGPAIAVSLVWIVVSYFPVSNIPITLPTVRAERFWYFPAIATSFLLALAFAKALRWPREVERPDLAPSPWILFGAFMLCQFVAARRHANDYTDDLVFWDATRHAVPRSAKAHLNYSVMQGARGNLEARLEANRTALELAPNWPMANVYLGDTLCRLHQPTEAWPYYARGFELSPNELALVALGVQCLWDEHALDDESPTRDELEDLGAKHPGSWLDFIARDTLANGEAHGGVDPKYRPRGYNEGPKGD
jgi:hypothetical protein